MNSTTTLKLDALGKLISGIAGSEANLNGALLALAQSGERDTELFAELCSIRDSIGNIAGRLQPSILLQPE